MRKSFIIAGLGLALFSGTVLAFGPRGADAPGHIEALADRLEVTDGQRAALRAVVDGSRPQLRALQDRARVNRQALRALDPAAADYRAQVDLLAAEHGEISSQMVRLRAGMRADIQAILTEEQRLQAAELRERRGPRGGREAGHRPRH